MNQIPQTVSASWITTTEMSVGNYFQIGRGGGGVAPVAPDCFCRHSSRAPPLGFCFTGTRSKVSRLNVSFALASHHVCGLPPTSYCSWDWTCTKDSHPNALPPLQSACMLEASTVHHLGGFTSETQVDSALLEKMLISPVGVSCTTLHCFAHI